MVIPEDPPEVTKVHTVVGTVYIRGLAFKARAGGRRQMVLLQLKKLDEGDTDLWLLKYAVVAALAFSVGGWVGSTWPMV